MSLTGPLWTPPIESEDDEKFLKQQNGIIPLSDIDRELLENQLRNLTI